MNDIERTQAATLDKLFAEGTTTNLCRANTNMTLADFNEISAKVAKLWSQVHDLMGSRAKDTDSDDDDEDTHNGPDTDSADDDEDEQNQASQALASGIMRKRGKADIGERKKGAGGVSAGTRLRKALRQYRKGGRQ